MGEGIGVERLVVAALEGVLDERPVDLERRRADDDWAGVDRFGGDVDRLPGHRLAVPDGGGDGVQSGVEGVTVGVSEPQVAVVAVEDPGMKPPEERRGQHVEVSDKQHQVGLVLGDGGHQPLVEGGPDIQVRDRRPALVVEVVDVVVLDRDAVVGEAVGRAGPEIVDDAADEPVGRSAAVVGLEQVAEPRAVGRRQYGDPEWRRGVDQWIGHGSRYGVVQKYFGVVYQTAGMEHITVEVAEGVGTVTIDRPERFNSFDVETAQDFRKAGLQLARDDDVRCAVVRGTGDVFCSGADLEYIYEGGDEAELSYLLPDAKESGEVEGYGRAFKQMLEYIHSAISEIRKARKPFVAAVNGVAAAGGFGIAMSCDLVYASEDASFEWAYPKTGLTGAESSTFFLPRLVGFRRVMELMLRSPRLDAHEAAEEDLINDVFPADEFDERVDEVAAELAAGPTEAFGIAKGLLNDAAGMDRLDPHLDEELSNLARIAEGRDFAEGIEAFFEKREPEFEGK